MDHNNDLHSRRQTSTQPSKPKLTCTSSISIQNVKANKLRIKQCDKLTKPLHLSLSPS